MSSGSESDKNVNNHLNKYVAKYILNNENKIYESPGKSTKHIDENIASKSQSTLEHVIKRIADSVKIYETPDNKFVKNKYKTDRSKMSRDFISFSQLQSENDVNTDGVFQNEFEIENDNVNNCKIDSQWNCDTQLATLMDNADALMNIVNSNDTMMQCCTSNIFDKQICNENQSVKKLGAGNESARGSNKNIIPDKCVTSVGNKISVISDENHKKSQNDCDIFKVPLSSPKIAKSKNKRVYSCSKSQSPISSTSNNFEPLLFSQYSVFETANQKNKNVSTARLERALKTFDEEDISSGCNLFINHNMSNDSHNQLVLFKDFRNGENSVENNGSMNEKHIDLEDNQISNKNMLFSKACECPKTEVKSTNNSDEEQTVLNESCVIREFSNSQCQNVNSDNQRDNSERSNSDDDDNLPSSPILITQKVDKKKGYCTGVTTIKKLENSAKSMSVDVIVFDKPETSKVDSFIGFRTANNKSIAVSEKSLKMVKDLFSDVTTNFSSEDVNNGKFNEKETFLDNESTKVYFKTGNNKDIFVSSNALSKANAIVNDIQNRYIEDLSCLEMKPQNDLTNTSYKSPRSFFGDVEVESEMINIDYEESNVNSAENLRFPCFTTASNKKIDISEKALEKAKIVINEVLHDSIPDSNTNEIMSTNNQNFEGFRTASNKHILVSDEALSKAKAVFEKIVEDDPKKIKRDMLNEIKTNKENSKTASNQFHFVTASNKHISVSVQSLRNAKVMLEEIISTDNSVEPIFDDPNNCVPSTFKGFSGFTTASNKVINVSGKSVTNAKALFGAMESEFKFESGDFKTLSNHVPGFTTASNKEIMVSKDALSKANRFFNDLNLETNKFETKTSLPSFEGFTTASNKIIPVSKEALSKAKNMINDLCANEILQPDLNTSPQISGFVTASNKKVVVNENALLKAKAIFNDIDLQTNVTNTNVVQSSTPTFSGYTTASNKNIPISEDSLLKAKAIFSDSHLKQEPINECTLNSVQPSSDQTFPGFLTANNKKIEVSKDALIIAKTIFDEDVALNQQNLCDTKHTSPFNDFMNFNIKKESSKVYAKFNGFSTASNKVINVSEDALIKAKAILNDDVTPDEQNVNLCDIKPVSSSNDFINSDTKEDLPKICTRFKGFKTASNKVINVSEDKFAEARKIFDNFDVVVGISDDANVVKIGNDKPKTSSEFLGFSTASNKTVKVSENGLAKAKMLFNDIVDEFSNDVDSMSSKKCDDVINVPFVRFSTASNNKIVISDEALKKAQNLFSDLDDDLLPVKSNDSTRNATKDDCNKAIHHEKLEHSGKNRIENLTQEISESTNALLCDEDLFISDIKNSSEDIEAPSSPILPSRPKRIKKSFKAPLKNGELPCIANGRKKRKLVNEDDKMDKPDVTSLNRHILRNICDETYKRNKNSRLKDYKPNPNKIASAISKITPANFMDYVFSNERLDILHKDHTSGVSIKDLEDIFLNDCSVDHKLIPEKWIVNHIKWIIWKLASYETFFGSDFNGVLTVGNVLKQLKYRYDKELHKAERALLRKILECDDVPGRKMVLCVSDVVKVKEENCDGLPNIYRYELEVTDGWYSVFATIDKTLVTAVTKGRLNIGTKIITCGAELVNCGQGISPLEDVSDVRLKLHGNSTRIAPWHSKLGVCHTKGLLRVSASSLKARAGPVPVLTFLPIVVYPQQFVEKLPMGDTVTRSERLEQVYLTSMEGDVQTRIEQLYLEVEKEILDKEKIKPRHIGCLNKRSLDRENELSDEDLLQAMEETSDPAEFLASLTVSQRESVNKAAADRQAKTREKIDTRVKEMMKARGIGNINRKVVAILKVRGLILEIDRSVKKVTPVMLTVWKAQEATIDLLNRMILLNLYWAIPTGTRMEELHLSTSNQTVLTEMKNQKLVNEFYDIKKYIRKCTPVSEMNHSRFSPLFNEVDTVGLVFKIEPSTMTQSNNTATNLQLSPNMQTVYIADDNCNICAIHFWGGIFKFGYEKTVEVGKIVACSNLQYRPRSSRKRFRNLYATEYTTFSQCPKKSYMNDSYRLLETKLSVLNINDYLLKCQKCLMDLTNETNCKINRDFSNSSHNSYINSRLKRKIDMDDNSLSGLDFDSSFNEPVSSCIGNTSRNISSSFSTKNISFDRETDLNTSDAERRIKKLRMYGEPPPLSPVTLNVSKTVKRDFVPPQTNENLTYDSKFATKYEKLCTVSNVENDFDANEQDFEELDKMIDKSESDPFKENLFYCSDDLNQ